MMFKRAAGRRMPFVGMQDRRTMAWCCPKRGTVIDFSPCDNTAVTTQLPLPVLAVVALQRDAEDERQLVAWRCSPLHCCTQHAWKNSMSRPVSTRPFALLSPQGSFVGVRSSQHW